jgi:hypothetical protein
MVGEVVEVLSGGATGGGGSWPGWVVVETLDLDFGFSRATSPIIYTAW